MADWTGNNIKLSIFGTSHGPYIGASIDGLPAGIKVNEDSIRKALSLRRPGGRISTARVEQDEFEIISGVFNGYTSGDCLTVIIANSDTRSKDYSELKIKPRPSHADYSANVKYDGFNDYRGGGHFSGRLTAAIVALCAIIRDVLSFKGITVGSHIRSIGEIEDDRLSFKKEELDYLNEQYFAVLNEETKDKMLKLIEEARNSQDSVGGIIETAVLGLPCGIGEPYFDSVESRLASLIFSIGGVKGVEFGSGFDISRMYGHEANDEFAYDNGAVITLTNHNGGINGGITNGMPLVVSTAIKPTPSISRVQRTVNLQMGENCELEIHGRHDPCIVHRARIVVDSLICFGLLDLCISEYGKRWCL